MDAVLCTNCGRQVEELAGQGAAAAPQIVINNANSNVNSNNMVGGTGMVGRPRDKIVALVLCIFLGYLGAHKFYEGKTGLGVLYFFTFGLFLVGVIIDFIALLAKPNPYYV
jgi:restriction system protein